MVVSIPTLIVIKVYVRLSENQIDNHIAAFHLGAPLIGESSWGVCVGISSIERACIGRKVINLILIADHSTEGIVDPEVPKDTSRASAIKITAGTTYNTWSADQATIRATVTVLTLTKSAGWLQISIKACVATAANR